MQDVVLVAVIVVFFVAAAGLVRACGRIAADTVVVTESDTEEEPSAPEDPA